MKQAEISYLRKTTSSIVREKKKIHISMHMKKKKNRQLLQKLLSEGSPCLYWGVHLRFKHKTRKSLWKQ